MARTWMSLPLLGGIGAASFLIHCADDHAANPVDAGLADAPKADVSSDAACTPIDAAALDAKQVQIGRTLAQNNKCIQCHGDTLAGHKEGLAVAGFGFAYPANLTPDPSTGIGCWSPQQIANAVLNGIDDEGHALCPPMPQFADAGFSQEDIDALIAFLRSVPPVVSDVQAMECESDAGTEDARADASADAGADSGPPDSSAPDSNAPDSSVGDASDGGLDAGDAAPE